MMARLNAQWWWPRWRAVIPTLLSGLGTCLLLSLLFLLVAAEIVEDHRLRLDEELGRWVREHDQPVVTRAMQLVTDLASTPVAVALWLFLVWWQVRQRRRRAAVLIVIVWP